MRLDAVAPEQVVQNTTNRSYYRMVRQEQGRVRIRPLELFPNGLLIEKSTDTIVEPDLDVEVVGDWHEDLVVSTVGQPVKRRETLERELERERAYLAELEATVVLPKGRGSHANKVKNVRHRITVLARGLEPREQPGQILQPDAQPLFNIKAGGLVCLPSGVPGIFQGFCAVAPGIQHATVRTTTGQHVVPALALSGIEQRYCATV